MSHLRSQESLPSPRACPLTLCKHGRPAMGPCLSDGTRKHSVRTPHVPATKQRLLGAPGISQWLIPATRGRWGGSGNVQNRFQW